MWPKPRKWFEPPPTMPSWYWYVYWAVPVVGTIIWFQYHSLTGLYVGAQIAIVIPLMWSKAPPRVRSWLALFLAALAAALFWTTLMGWPL